MANLWHLLLQIQWHFSDIVPRNVNNLQLKLKKNYFHGTLIHLQLFSSLEKKEKEQSV